MSRGFWDSIFPNLYSQFYPARTLSPSVAVHFVFCEKAIYNPLLINNLTHTLF